MVGLMPDKEILIECGIDETLANQIHSQIYDFKVVDDMAQIYIGRFLVNVPTDVIEWKEEEEIELPINAGDKLTQIIHLYSSVQDSGKRQEFETGSVRDTREGKGRYDLIPYEPHRRLAVHYENGAKKYGDRNWEKGQNLMRYLDSAERHLQELKVGMNNEDHAAAVIWNLYGFIATQKWIEEGKLPKELDDYSERIK